MCDLPEEEFAEYLAFVEAAHARAKVRREPSAVPAVPLPIRALEPVAA